MDVRAGTGGPCEKAVVLVEELSPNTLQSPEKLVPDWLWKRPGTN